MSRLELDEILAIVLLALAPTRQEPDLFLDRKRSGIIDIERGQSALGKLKRAGLVDSRKLGERNQGWRLTEAGSEALTRAQEVVDAARRERSAQWERQNQVFGADWLTDGTELSKRQQRAWVRGYMEAMLATMNQAPEGAPAIVRENWGELRDWMSRHLAPYRPEGMDPNEAPVRSPRLR